MRFFVAYYAAFAHLIVPGLELGFDQSDDLTPIGKPLPRPWENQAQRDKRHIDGHQIHALNKTLQIARIDAFHHDDARILA